MGLCGSPVHAALAGGVVEVVFDGSEAALFVFDSRRSPYGVLLEIKPRVHQL